MALSKSSTALSDFDWGTATCVRLEVRPGVPGVELDDLAEVGDRLVGLSFRLPRQAPSVERSDVPGVDLDAFVELGECLVVLLPLIPEAAAVVVRRDQLGVDADGLGAVDECLVVLLLLTPGRPRSSQASAWVGSSLMTSPKSAIARSSSPLADQALPRSSNALALPGS